MDHPGFQAGRPMDSHFGDALETPLHLYERAHLRGEATVVGDGARSQRCQLWEAQTKERVSAET